VIRAGIGTAFPFLGGGVGSSTGALVRLLRQPAGAPLSPPVPLQAPLTYVAIGASDTIGWGTPHRSRDGWVPLLRHALPQPAQSVNLGVGGTTLREALAVQLPRAIEAQPHLVTIWLVVNDVLGGVPLDRYRADLDHLLGALRVQTNAVVAIGNAPYPPARLDPWGFPDLVRRMVAGQWNRVIASAARAHGALVVDLYARWPLDTHPEFIGPDGLHPTAAGYRALADTFLATLREQRVLARLAPEPA
jgi:lysophospholipase L1-like esterase